MRETFSHFREKITRIQPVMTCDPENASSKPTNKSKILSLSLRVIDGGNAARCQKGVKHNLNIRGKRRRETSSNDGN